MFMDLSLSRSMLVQYKYSVESSKGVLVAGVGLGLGPRLRSMLLSKYAL